MNLRRIRRFILELAIASCAALILAPASFAARITIVNMDGAGEGFNDPTVIAPAGGNPGTTVGQARLNVFQRAADTWGRLLDSNVEIFIEASFDPLDCTSWSGTLGLGGPTFVHANFTATAPYGAPRADTAYVHALANAIHGSDLNAAASDIEIHYNSSVGTAGCLTTLGWYYGFDGAPPGSDLDLYSIALHEIAHGLGFLALVDLATGEKFALGTLGPADDAYMVFLEHHGATPDMFPDMTDAQRLTAMTADPDLHWVGPLALAEAAAIPLTAGFPSNHVQMFAPSPADPGSSVSHFSDLIQPDQAMEPSYTHPIHDPGLTLPLLQDVGWRLLQSEVVLVLDDTGSMTQPTGDGTGNSKIQSLRNAVGMFTTILADFRGDTSDRIGALGFKVPSSVGWTGPCLPGWTQTLVAMGDADVSLPLIVPAVNAMPADGYATPLRAGIESGSDLLNAAAAGRRRVMVLMSDGKQNTNGCYVGPPHAPETLAAFKADRITDRDIHLLAVGFGSGGQIDDALLSDLATDGFYDSATSAIDLNKWFAQALGDVLSQSIVVDPQGVLSAGGEATHALPLIGGNRSVTFIASWARAGTEIELDLIMPDGTAVSAAHAAQPGSGVTYLGGPTFRTMVLRQPLGGDLAGRPAAGQWRARLRRAGGPAGQDQDEPYLLMVMADSNLRMGTEFVVGKFETGGMLPVRASITGVARVTVEADIFEPVAGVGATLSSLGATDAQVRKLTSELPQDLDLLARRVHLLKKKGVDWPIERRIQSITLLDQGKDADCLAGDGVYTGSFGPLKVDGVYSVRFRASGLTLEGEEFLREFRRGVYAGVGVSARGTGLTLNPVGRSGRAFELVLQPRDDNGLLLGPGFISALQLSAPNLDLGEVEDLGDGSYRVGLQLPAGDEVQTLEVSLGGKPLRTLSVQPGGKPSAWPWLLVVILAVLLVLLWMKRKVKETV
jgi:hypothetical protein